MARRPNVTLAPFACYVCHQTLGYTTKGEASRMNERAHLYCEACKDIPSELTPVQKDFLAALTSLNEQGKRASVSAAGKALGLSVSRAQQISTAIRARGDGDLLDRAMGKDDENDEPATAAVVEPAPAVKYEPPQYAEPMDPAEYVAPLPPTSPFPLVPVLPPSPSTGNNPTALDPAAMGATME